MVFGLGFDPFPAFLKPAGVSCERKRLSSSVVFCKSPQIKDLEGETHDSTAVEILCLSAGGGRVNH